MSQPNLYIIAGCNGAGKTTASLTVLPRLFVPIVDVWSLYDNSITIHPVVIRNEVADQVEYDTIRELCKDKMEN